MPDFSDYGRLMWRIIKGAIALGIALVAALVVLIAYWLSTNPV